MAAALFRGAPGLCVRCFHRELCRVVWRPQAALFSTKPPDRKPPRRTHIKKAKPQPAVDIAKLLEQLFSQKRPGTAPPAAGKAKSASSKPSTTSSVKVSSSHVPHLSKTEPTVSVSPTASSVSVKTASTSTTASLSPQPKPATPTNPNILFSSETPQQLPHVVAQDVISNGVSSVSVHVTSSSPPTSTLGLEAASVENQTKVETATEAAPSSAHIVDQASVPAATGEAPIETTKESTVETSLPIEALESAFSVADGPVEPIIDITVDTEVAGTSRSSTVETSITPLEQIDSIAAEGAVEPPIEFEERVVNILNTTKEEASLETVTSPVESSARASAEVPVASAVFPHTTTVEPVIEATIDLPTVETLETGASVAEGAAETTIEAKDETKTIASDTATVESTIEPLDEANTSPLQSQATVEPTVETEGVDNLPYIALVQNAHESEVTKVESTTEPTVEPVESEQMTLESVTLHSVKTLVESLKTDELLQTKSILEEKAGKQVEELMLVQTGSGTQLKAVAEDESETLTKALSQWDSISEDLQEFEGEAGSLVTELLCHVPAAISKPPPPPATVNRSSASDRPSAVNEDSLQKEQEVNVEEALTLESVTLAIVKAEVGGLETEFLQEASNALEKEADELVLEEKMEVRMETEEDVVFEDTTEAEILRLDSISEATKAIEAETSVILEAMFGSEQGVSQPPETLKVPQSEMIDQEVEKESREQEGNILEAMSLESVTLAEVEASLGTLENESLSKTAAFLENEAEILAVETRTEVEDLPPSDDQGGDLSVESPALPEADGLSEDLQTDGLMEQLLFTVPGPAAGLTGVQRPAGAKTLDAAVTTESAVVVDTAAPDTNNVPAPPGPKEVLLGQEVVEDGAQTEASENEEPTGTHSDMDPIQRLFLEKIREYDNMHRLGGGPVEAGPEYERYLSEETAKLQRQYGGGDLSSFPQFTFTEPKMDEDSK